MKKTIAFGAVVIVTILVLGIQWIRREQTTSAYYNCITALKIIDGANQQWALEFHKTTNDVPQAEDIVGPNHYIKVMPACPQGGIYSIGKMSDDPTCSIGGEYHSLPAR